MSSACTDNLVMAISVVEGRCAVLSNGGIPVSKLRELQKFEEKFVTVIDLMKNTEFSGQLVSKLIKLRCKEVAAVEYKASLVTTLTSICHYLPGGKFNSVYAF